MSFVRQHVHALVVISLFPLAVGCGGSGSASSPTVIVAISPQTISMGVGATQLFETTVTGASNMSVTWSVTEPAAVAWLSVMGPATASFTPMDTGTFHIVATSVANTNVSATATVEVVIPSSLPPLAAVVAPGDTIRLPAQALPGVVWSVLEQDGGTIDLDGNYTAPERDGVYHVVATCPADPRLNGVIEVTVRTL